MQGRPSYQVSRDRFDGAIENLKVALAGRQLDDTIQLFVDRALHEIGAENHYD